MPSRDFCPLPHKFQMSTPFLRETLKNCTRVQYVPAEPVTNVCCFFSLEIWHPLRPKYPQKNTKIPNIWRKQERIKPIRKGSAGAH